MILRQYLHTDPVVAASYLLGCGGRGIAVVVDPVEAVEGYVADAGAMGMEIRYVIDTHVHADHLSRARGEEPWSVLTGHTLLVGDMGRTELATSAEDGARALFRSAARLRALPDPVEVLPGAFSGSVCGRGPSGKPFSTIGYERRLNRAFGTLDEGEFVRRMTERIPPRPPRADEVRARNLGLAPGRV